MVGEKIVRQRTLRSGLTLIEVFVALAIIVVVVALFLPATRTAGPAARRTQCMNNLKQIGLALHNYHDVYGAFPPAYTVDADGRPLHSWRTLILPYLDQSAVYNKIDLSKPWNDPVNADAVQSRIHVYQCPSDSLHGNETSYLAVVTQDSCLRPRESRSISEIKDGTSNTIFVIEVPHNQTVPWMEPRDADEGVLAAFQPKSKENHEGGRNVLMGDGAVRFISQKIDPKTFHALLTATGGETVGEF